MGWGPVDWVGMVLPEANIEEKSTSVFEILTVTEVSVEISFTLSSSPTLFGPPSRSVQIQL